jgi:hypothetical protein
MRECGFGGFGVGSRDATGGDRFGESLVEAALRFGALGRTASTRKQNTNHANKQHP